MPEHSDRLNKLATALARVQAEIEPLVPDAAGVLDDAGEERAYGYATLASVSRAIRGPLARNGLSVVQTGEPGEAGELRLVTTLLHRSGQWIAGTTVLPLETSTPRGYGSALTYARRYGPAAIVGLCIDHDDDGAAAERTGSTLPARDGEEHVKRAGSAGPGAWWKVPCNRATAAQLKAFARAYARAKGVPSVDGDELRRDLGIDGRLADHFGDTPLGEIVARARRNHPARGAGEATAPEEVDAPRAEAA